MTVQPDHLTEEVKREVTDVVGKLRDVERSRRFDLDVRGVLAILINAGLLSVILIQLLVGKPIAVPAELAAIAGSVTGFYFGGRSNGRSWR